MNCQEAIQYIHAHSQYRHTPGPAQIRALLAAIGNPQTKFRCIHVAGTNGKGSVCAMLESILRTAGYRVGMFISPYVRCFHERMRTDGILIRDEELVEITEFIRPYADAMDEKLNEFELITAIGFEFFRRRGVEYVVLETGLGGRLDPTNIIENPLLSIITEIDFDHTEQLGNTLQAIAAEKAGIIKEGRPCLFGGRGGSACRTVRAVADMRHAPFYTVDRSDYRVTEKSLDGTVFQFQSLVDLKLPLLGSYQPFNAAIVLTALNILQKEGICVTEETLRRGLQSVRWPARFEVLRRNPLLIFDGGHNPQGVAAAVKSIRVYFPEQKVNILTGVMADKDYDEMIENLKPVTERAFTVCPENPRALSAEAYAQHFISHKIPAVPYSDISLAIRDACKISLEENRPLICLGSLYLYNTILQILENMQL